MADELDATLTDLAAEDRHLVQQSVAAGHLADQYRIRADQQQAPSPDVVADARGMRLIQLGEATTHLQRDGILKSNETVAPGTLSADLVKSRTQLVHSHVASTLLVPDRVAVQADLLQTFQKLQTQHPGNVDIRSAIEALQHLDPAKPSPTTWNDAENFQRVRSGQALADMSRTGKYVLEAATQGESRRVMEHRSLLTHEYETAQHPPVGPQPPIGRQVTAIENGEAGLTSPAYRQQLIGNRTEPVIAEMVEKWVKPNPAAPQTNHTKIGRDLIVEELSHQAKTGAPVEAMQELHEVVSTLQKGVSGRLTQINQTKIAKTLSQSPQKTVQPTTWQALDRLNNAAQSAYGMTDRQVFDDARTQLGAAEAQAQKPPTPRGQRRNGPQQASTGDGSGQASTQADTSLTQLSGRTAPPAPPANAPQGQQPAHANAHQSGNQPSTTLLSTQQKPDLSGSGTHIETNTAAGAGKPVPAVMPFQVTTNTAGAPNNGALVAPAVVASPTMVTTSVPQDSTTATRTTSPSGLAQPPAPSAALPTGQLPTAATLNETPAQVPLAVAPIKPVSSLRTIDSHAGRTVGKVGTAVGAVQTVVAIREGDYVAAAQRGTVTTLGAAMQTETGVKTVGKLLSKAAPSVIRAGGEEIPVVGAFVAAGFALYDIGSVTYGAITGQNPWSKVGTTTVANIAEIGGGVVGFGAGQAARQGVVETSKWAFGAAAAPSDCAVVGLGKEIYGAVTAPNTPPAVTQNTTAIPGPPPVIPQATTTTIDALQPKQPNGTVPTTMIPAPDHSAPPPVSHQARRTSFSYRKMDRAHHHTPSSGNPAHQEGATAHRSHAKTVPLPPGVRAVKLVPVSRELPDGMKMLPIQRPDFSH